MHCRGIADVPPIAIANLNHLQPLARGRGLLERRVAPVPQGRMLFVEELEGVTAVGEKVTEELEAASRPQTKAGAHAPG